MAAPTVYPGAKRFVGWAKEVTPGTPVAPTVTMPVDSCDPDPQITWLDDTALRGSMAELYGRYPGPQMGGLDIKGPVFADSIGHPLYNLLGDYAVQGSAAPYTHTFALLNSGSAQPVTHTITDYTGTTATVGARAYPWTCLTDITLTWNAEQLCTWEGKAVGMIGAPAASAPTPSLSTVAQPIPSWRGQIGIGGPASGGTLMPNVSELEVTLSRTVTSYNTIDGTPDPYTFARGTVTASGKLTVVAKDENPLLNMLNNVQPQLQVILTNGGSGSGLVSLQLDVQKAAYKTTKITFGDVFTYEVEWDAVSNTTNVGGSAGYGPATLTLQNAVTTY